MSAKSCCRMLMVAVVFAAMLTSPASRAHGALYGPHGFGYGLARVNTNGSELDGEFIADVRSLLPTPMRLVKVLPLTPRISTGLNQITVRSRAPTWMEVALNSSFFLGWKTLRG
ncbi:MAG: hypothetical protein ACTHK3_02670 [Solirubrobacterales bacterium]